MLKIPALHERAVDVELLVGYFLDALGAKYRREEVKVEQGAMRLLSAHRWPGNIRELRNLLEQVMILHRGARILAEDLHRLTHLGATNSGPSTDAFHLPDEGFDLEQHERSLLVMALERHQWNVSHAARMLNLSRDTMRYRMEKFEIERS